tara:strand:- start:208 stop:1749 length:1542 start_codon:yes stop_codon:yes gene_type:complete
MTMTPDQARKTIADIQRHQTTLVERGDVLEAKNNQLEKKVKDLTDAHRVLTERQFTEPTPYGGNLRLDEYVDKSWSSDSGRDGLGPVHWGPHEKTVRLPDIMGGAVVKTTDHGLLSDPAPADQWHQDLIKMVSTRNLARMAMRLSQKGWDGSRGTDPANTPGLDYELYKHLLRCPSRSLRVAIEKAFYDTSGSGAEWIPDQFIPSVYQAFQVPRRLRALLQVVPVTGNTVLRPRLTVGARPYIKGNISTDDPRRYTASTPTTADTTISMSGLAVRCIVDDAALEDSAVAAGTILRREIVNALDDGFEDAMINADSNATHQDTALSSWNVRSRWGASGLGGDADHRRYFLGWRAAAFDASQTTDLSGTMSAANFATMKGSLGERGVGNLVCVTSPEAMVKDFLTLTQVLTVDAYGPAATIHTGELGQLLGTPLILSRFVSNDLPVSGLYTTAGATTGAVLADLDAWQRYVKRGATVEVDKEIVSGSVNMVATIREVMDTPDAAATANCHFGFNL